MALSFGVTPALREAAELAGLSLETEASVTLEQVQRISHTLKQKNVKKARLQHLLQGAQPILPYENTQKRLPHPDLADRLAVLKNEQESREYAAMVGDVLGSSNSALDFAEMRTFRSQMAIGANLVVSMGTMFCVGYYAGGTELDPHGPRAISCGVILMIATMLIEVILFLIGTSRTEEKIAKRERDAKRGVYDLTQLREMYPEETRKNARTRQTRLADWRGLNDL